jgi:peptidyl-prolyl cis-trans isomerase SurA
VADQERQSTIQFLDSIRVMLISGKSSMTSQAAKWSEDPGSKFGGGCYPMQQKGTFVPPYEEAVFTTPIGSYSEVFESEYGFHFVYVKNRQGNQYEACHILRIPKVDVAALDRSRNRLDSIGTLIKADSLSFKVAVSKFSTDEETRNQEGRVINPETGGTSFDINAISDPNILLTLNTLKVGGISEPIRITKKDGSQAWVIFRLDKRIPAHKANLKDDYLIFKDQAEANKQQEVLLDWVAKQVQKTYVQIDEDFTPCTFQFDWSTAKGTQSH